MAEIRADVEKVLAKGWSQLGTSESPKFSNIQPYGAWYGMNGVAWCAMFVSWCFWHGGSPLPPIRTSKGFAYCPDVEGWARANGRWKETGERGDIIVFKFGFRADHVGIVLGRLSDGRYHTLEGNTDESGSRTGGKVMEKYRRSGIYGFVDVTNTTSAPVPRPVEPKGMKLGDSGVGVTFLQNMLNLLVKQRGGKIIKVDGQFGNETAAAVMEYQKFHRAMQILAGERRESVLLNVSGVAGPVTLAGIGFWVNRLFKS